MSSTINELQVSYIHLVLQYPRDTAVVQKMHTYITYF